MSGIVWKMWDLYSAITCVKCLTKVHIAESFVIDFVFFFFLVNWVFIDVLSVRIMLCIHVYTSSGVFGAIRVAIYNIVMMCHDVASFVCVCSMVDLKCGGSFTLGQNVLTWTWIVAEIVKCMFLCKWWDWFVMMNYLLKWRVWNEL